MVRVSSQFSGDSVPSSSHSSFFDSPLKKITLENPFDVNTGSVNCIGIEFSYFGQMLDFGDGSFGGGGHHGIEIARSFSIYEITPFVALPGFDESEVSL